MSKDNINSPISLWDTEDDMVDLNFMAILAHIAKNLKTIRGRRQKQWEYCFHWSIYAQISIFGCPSSELVALETLGTWLAWYKQNSLFPVIHNIHKKYATRDLDSVEQNILQELYSLYTGLGTYTYTQYLISEFGKISKGEVLLNTIELENFTELLNKEIRFSNSYDLTQLPQTTIDILLDMPI